MTAADTAAAPVPALPLGHALAAPLLDFSLLPSRNLHPSRAHLLPPSALPHPRLPAQARRLQHRDGSAALLARLDADAARPVTDLSQPALPLALAPPPLLQRIARAAGSVLLGAHLRRAIARADVADAQAALGDDGLALAREGGLHPGLADAARWLADGLAPAADLLGAALLGRAWQDAPAAIRQRADWKLPQAADAAAARDAAGLDAPAARNLCLHLLARLEPTWLSSFPTSPTPQAAIR